MSTGSEKLKVVIDTNVFVSGLNFTGVPSEVLELFINDEIEVYVSSFILKEVEKILKEKFEWKEEQIQRSAILVISPCFNFNAESQFTVANSCRTKKIRILS